MRKWFKAFGHELGRRIRAAVAIGAQLAGGGITGTRKKGRKSAQPLR